VAQNGLERLVLILPIDPSLRRLTQLVARHFFRQHGLVVSQARRQARRVEAHCLRLLRHKAAREAGRPLVLELIARRGVLEVTGRATGRGPALRILRIDRPAKA
jgi:hypothetical protein